MSASCERAHQTRRRVRYAQQRSHKRVCCLAEERSRDVGRKVLVVLEVVTESPLLVLEALLETTVTILGHTRRSYRLSVPYEPPEHPFHSQSAPVDWVDTSTKLTIPLNSHLS